MTTEIKVTEADMADVEEDRSVASLPAPGFSPDKFRPIGDQMLVQLESLPDMIGRIVIPDTAKGPGQRWATVIKVGPGARAKRGRDVPDFGPGDRVLLGPDPGWELPARHRVLRVGAVMAVEASNA